MEETTFILIVGGIILALVLFIAWRTRVTQARWKGGAVENAHITHFVHNVLKEIKAREHPVSVKDAYVIPPEVAEILKRKDVAKWREDAYNDFMKQFVKMLESHYEVEYNTDRHPHLNRPLYDLRKKLEAKGFQSCLELVKEFDYNK